MDLELHQFDQRYGRCGGLAAIRLDRWRVGALEEGGLLAELGDRFGMTVGELGRQFDRSASWMTRRLIMP